MTCLFSFERVVLSALARFFIFAVVSYHKTMKSSCVLMAFLRCDSEPETHKQRDSNPLKYQASEDCKND
jgi:hypothetical protein